MKHRLSYLIYCLLLLALACQDNEADFPELNTEDAQQIGATSVVMGAEIKEIGPVRPVEIRLFPSGVKVSASHHSILISAAAR